MNKYKKIATAVVATVMAGTMVASLAACGPNDGPGNATDAGIAGLLSYMNSQGLGLRETTNANAWNTAKDYYNYLKDHKDTTVSDPDHILNDGELNNINYGTYTSRGNVTLNVAVGHNNAQTSTHYATSTNLGTITLPDGNQYTAGSAKPAWKAMGQDLNITWNEVYQGKQTSKNLEYMTSNQNSDGKTYYSQTDLFTTDLSAAVEYVGKGTKILNLGDYLDRMPHFKNYLESNAVVYLSLLQAGMSTTDGSGKVIYVAPYFDGNDTIERYCLIRQDWADKLLNGATDLTGGEKFSEACGNVAVSEYMQSTGKLEVESSNAGGTAKTKITKNYDAALTAAKNTSTALGHAYQVIAGEAYNGTSGNIVSIMNAALAKNADATGSQLANLFRAYIDVCYDGYYTADNRSDLFNGYDACWDVDDLVALLRCVKTNSSNLVAEGHTVYGIVPRTGQNDRTPDMVRLAADLYGVRGADSRYEYTYLDKNGTLQDARNDAEFYEALKNMNTLKQEGLVADYPAKSTFSFNGGSVKKDGDGKLEAFMMYDYSQTQTQTNFYAHEGASTSITYAEDFNFAPILNPVAKWDVDGNGTIDSANEIFRFTESWRSVKTSGLALNGSLAEAGNEAKLTAALQFVDYLFSSDGQIVSTYGPKASNSTGTGGFWYNEKAPASATDGVFTFKGEKYYGTQYDDRYTPTITDKLYQSFLGKEVNGLAIGSKDDIKGGILSFTDYARRIIGSTLPVGIKDQSFENQLTSQNGKAGANKVGAALKLGTVRGMLVDIDKEVDFEWWNDANRWWYVCVPTGVPVNNQQNTVLNDNSQLNLKYMTGTQKNNKDFFSIFNYIILNGTSGTYNQQDVTYTFAN